MGYRPEAKRFRLAFEEEHELHGLQLVTRSVPIGTILSVLRAAGSGAKREPAPEDIEAVQGLFEEFGGALVEWNLEHPETGEPVPASPDGVRTLDFDLVSRIALEWVQAVMGASAPLGAGSNGGRPAPAFPVSSIPMAPRSSSRAS